MHWVGWRGGDSIRDQQLPEAPSHTPTNQLPTRIYLWLRKIVHFIWNCENKDKIIALFGQNSLKETPQPTNCQLELNSDLEK